MPTLESIEMAHLRLHAWCGPAPDDVVRPRLDAVREGMRERGPGPGPIDDASPGIRPVTSRCAASQATWNRAALH